MAEILTILKKRTNDDWLIGYDTNQFYCLTESYFEQFKQQNPPNILIAEQDPFKFLGIFLAAVAAKIPIFLCNPDWKKQEWQQVLELVKPGLIFSGGFIPEYGCASTFVDRANLIMIPTGGTSGKVRFAMHTWESLNTSVKGFREYFQVDLVNAFCCLPVYHVSGLMQFLRSFLTGGKFIILPYKELKHKPPNIANLNNFFISLVPTQLQFILQHYPQWLSQFYTVLLGGAPPWQSLLQRARAYNIRLAPTYGMTETASQIATLKPEDFLSGNDSSGKVLPHAQIKLLNIADGIGTISIQSNSLFLGYYPHSLPSGYVFETDDLGYLDAHGYLHIVGRNSQKIISGGENIFPSEVERVILDTQLVKDVAVLGLPDSYWGEMVAAVYLPVSDSIAVDDLKLAIQDKIAPYKQPKKWIKSDSSFRNSQGKLNYTLLQSFLDF